MRSQRSTTRFSSDTLRQLGVLVVAVLGLTVFVGPVANAASWPSSKAYYGPVGGYSYFNQSDLIFADTSTSKWAEVDATTTSSSTPPAGSIGTQPTLYRNNAQCAASAMKYASYATKFYSTSTNPKTCGSGVYYAKGSTAAYNGNGYNTYYTNSSPSQNANS